MVFILRKEHEQAISRGMERRFDQRAATFLRTHHGDRLTHRDNAAVLRLVASGRLRARQLELTSERQIVRFLQCVVLLNDALGPDTEQQTALQLLQDQASTPEDRVRQTLLYVDPAAIRFLER